MRFEGEEFFIQVDSRACMCVYIYMRACVCVCVIYIIMKVVVAIIFHCIAARFWRDGISDKSLATRELKKSAEFSPQGRRKWHGSMAPKRGEKKRKRKEKEGKKRGKKEGKGFSTTTFISCSPHPSFSSLNLCAHLFVVCQYRWV